MKYFTNFFESKIKTSLSESPEGYDDENTVPMHKYLDKLNYPDLFSHTGKHSDEHIAKTLHDVANEKHSNYVSEKAYKILTNRYPHINGYAENIREKVRNSPNDYSAQMVSHVLASTEKNDDVVKTLKNMSSSHYFFRSPFAFIDSGISNRIYDKKSYDDISKSDIKHKHDILSYTEHWKNHDE